MKQQQNKTKKDNKKGENIKIKYDIITPEERDPQPKSFDEIEY